MGLAEPRLEVVLGELVEELRRGVGASLRVVELEQGHFVSGGAPVWGELRGLVALHCVLCWGCLLGVLAWGCCTGLLLVLLPGKDEEATLAAGRAVAWERRGGNAGLGAFAFPTVGDFLNRL